MNDNLLRARGCLLGQLIGDSLGSLVEFQGPEAILKKHPNGVRELVDGGTWNTIAGQPTDDSEMALALARSIVAHGTYDASDVLSRYTDWLDSDPFDCGLTIRAGIRGKRNFESQANGALMRVAPIGIFGSNHLTQTVANWAMNDAALTHPNVVCLQINALFAMGISFAVSRQHTPESIYQHIRRWSVDLRADESVLSVIDTALTEKPVDYVEQQGWVLIAFQNALWQLVNSESLEEAIIDTVMRGGDTDTNAAICGALLGAVHGIDAMPRRWVDAVLGCRPSASDPRVRRPRPEVYWPVDAFELADALVKR